VGGDILHEYGHALCEHRFGDLYVERVPQWLNEGLANAIAGERYRDFARSFPDTVRRAYAQRAPPTYEHVSRALYDADPDARYAIAHRMVERLLKHRGATIAGLLDEARRGQDFEAAVAAVGGATGPDLLDEVLRDWEVAPPRPARR
jgi:hypothetical protein